MACTAQQTVPPRCHRHSVRVRVQSCPLLLQHSATLCRAGLAACRSSSQPGSWSWANIAKHSLQILALVLRRISFGPAHTGCVGAGHEWKLNFKFPYMSIQTGTACRIPPMSRQLGQKSSTTAQVSNTGAEGVTPGAGCSIRLLSSLGMSALQLSRQTRASSAQANALKLALWMLPLGCSSPPHPLGPSSGASPSHSLCRNGHGYF